MASYEWEEDGLSSNSADPREELEVFGAESRDGSNSQTQHYDVHTKYAVFWRMSGRHIYGRKQVMSSLTDFARKHATRYIERSAR